MIEIKNLCKSFGDRVLFHDFSYMIEDGVFLMIKGKSGSGKTTLLNMLGGIESFDSGDILINGCSIKNKKYLNNYYKYEVGFLFQNFALIESRSVKDNMELIRKETRSEYDLTDSLKMVGMDGFIDTKVYKLSGGEQQRIALARLIYKKCNIILADEPTGSLDKENAGKVMDILKMFNQNGKTIIMVTHDEDLLEYATRVIDIDLLKRE